MDHTMMVVDSTGLTDTMADRAVAAMPRLGHHRQLEGRTAIRVLITPIALTLFLA